MNELKGKVAIVTGASTPSGIGNAIAKRFARAGASVLCVAEATQEQLDTVVRECRAFEESGRVESALIDLGEPGAPERMVQMANELFGRVDVLVNNAGIRAPVNFGDYTREQFDRVVSVNLAAAFFASQAVPPDHADGKAGDALFTWRRSFGHVTYGQRALYGLTKAALIHLTKSMAYELGRENIIVNAISPGPIATGPILARPPEETRQRVEQYIPAGRVGEPAEIADLALYLASSSPAFLQGQDIVIDGGYIIH
jgi:NAD(P)-dependent dehydrogenase (short-subunit alcohol dehydrogenase family)